MKSVTYQRGFYLIVKSPTRQSKTSFCITRFNKILGAEALRGDGKVFYNILFCVGNFLFRAGPLLHAFAAIPWRIKIKLSSNSQGSNTEVIVKFRLFRILSKLQFRLLNLVFVSASSYYCAE